MTTRPPQAPCPCGSARTLDDCCGRPGGGDYTPAERSAAVAKLQSFGERGEFGSSLRRAGRQFLPEDLRRERPELVEQLMEQVGFESFMNYSLFDFPLADRTTIAQRFLRLHGSGLPPRERGWIAQMAVSPLDAYEVEVVYRDRGLVLRHLGQGSVVRVREARASAQLAPGDLLLARVTQQPDGTPVLESPALVLPPEQEHAVVECLDRAAGRTPGRRFDLAHELVHVYVHWWLAASKAPPPKLVNHDGDPLDFCRTEFAVGDRARLEAALARHEDWARQDDGAWEWSKLKSNAMRLTLGQLELQESRAVLETNSRERALRGRELLEAIAGAGVRHVRTVSEDAGKAMAKAKSRTGAQADSAAAVPMDDPAAIEAVRQAMEQHYRDWLDVPLPALGGRTPRQAVVDAPAKVLRLLWQLEQPLPGGFVYDAGWMYRELGLERPGAGEFVAGFGEG